MRVPTLVLASLLAACAASGESAESATSDMPTTGSTAGPGSSSTQSSSTAGSGGDGAGGASSAASGGGEGGDTGSGGEGGGGTGGGGEGGEGGGVVVPDLPGAVCVGALTDGDLIDLYTDRPVTGTPSFLLGGSSQARNLGAYTSKLYVRACDSTSGCEPWQEAVQPNYESFYSIAATIRHGSVYLWQSGGVDRVGIVSATVGTDCKGWTEGTGDLVRNGDDASVTLGASVEDSCVAGADPIFFFEEKDLYDPTGVVTGQCMKLVYTKKRNVVTVGDAEIYDEYAVVYDASF